MTRTARRFRLIVRYSGEMAQVEDTGHPDFGVRGRSCAVTRLIPFAEAKEICDRLETQWRTNRH